MSGPLITCLVDEGLGNSTYLVDLGDGRALAVDPSLDLRSLRQAAERRGLALAYSAETHLHADFLSGSLQLATTDGATVLGSAAGHREFAHRGLDEGDEVDLGGLTLRALATPGHTAEHLSYLLLDGSSALGVFTGGSLIVGAAARTDLAGAERTEELARQQYRSLRRLVGELPDDTAVYPTHGAGSFCSAPPGAARTSTIGHERATNPLLGAADEDTFVVALLAGLGSFPPYFLRLGEVNRRGPGIIAAIPELTALSPDQVAEVARSGGQVIDVRSFVEFAEGHIPGALSIQLRPAFATWLGWLADPGRPIVVVRDAEQDASEVLWQALKIGIAPLLGELAGGMAAWRAAGHPMRTLTLVGAGRADPNRVVDVRQRGESAAGSLPGARRIELGHVTDRIGDLPAGSLQLMCGHGERAATAASLIAATGRGDISIITGGPDDWATENRRPLQVDA